MGVNLLVGPMRALLLSTTWHNFLGTARTTSKAFFSHAATGTMGGTLPQLKTLSANQTPRPLCQFQIDPAVSEHRWSCSTVAMLVTSPPSTLLLDVSQSRGTSV